MQSFRAFLQQEALGSPVAWKWTKPPSPNWSRLEKTPENMFAKFEAIAEFTVDGLDYEVGFDHMQTPKRTEWYVDFKFADVYAARQQQQTRGVAPTGLIQSPFDASGTGDPYKVMSTVIAVVKEFLRIVKPEALLFSGANKETAGKSIQQLRGRSGVSGRNRLYTRLVQMAPTVFPDYTYKITPTKNGWGSTLFRLIRNS